jgi:RNase H-fold protein (predicted Holliday junction resolvase)
MGESKDYAGEENPIGVSARAFTEELIRAGVAVVFEPEVLSSKEAERIQGKNDLTDASAAAIILQSYIERQRHGNQR